MEKTAEEIRVEKIKCKKAINELLSKFQRDNPDLFVEVIPLIIESPVADRPRYYQIEIKTYL